MESKSNDYIIYKKCAAAEIIQAEHTLSDPDFDQRWNIVKTSIFSYLNSFFGEEFILTDPNESFY